MFARVYSLGTWALEGFVVTAEVDISGGLPQFAIVGLPDNAVKEATDRVRSALKNLGFTYPVSRITVNLAPADRKKTGPVYDLPLLLGVLAASEQIAIPPQDCAFIGELSLDGQVRAVSGVLPMALACAGNGIKRLFVPRENAQEAAVAEGLQVYPIEDVRQLLAHLTGEALLEAVPPIDFDEGVCGAAVPDFGDVHGQLEARRAMEIAAAGLHNLVMVGAPGAGKSMLAKRLPGILPPMQRSESIETSKIYSVAGMLKKGEEANGCLHQTRPFRAPHHSVSAAGLAGGSGQLRPGEISLAHNGVLFLDELPEFSRAALEVLRQPLEDGQVTISRVSGTVTYPSRFMLVAAMNPCPCGYFGHPTRECRCLGTAMERYLQKVSGPLLDRIDLHIEVQPVDYEAISAPGGGEKSAEILKRVLKARQFQAQRSQGEVLANAALQGERLRRDARLTDRAAGMMKLAFEKMGLSARGYDRVLRVSRTIADLDGAEMIDTPHVSEAVQYRNLDRKYWHTR